MSLPPVESHIVAFPYEAWGHARPLITLCARVVKARPVLVTFLTPITLADRTRAELPRHFEAGEEDYLTRVRVVALEHAGAVTSEALDNGYAAALQKLLGGEDIACVQTGTTFPAGPKPQAVILDCFAHKPLRDTKAIGGDAVKAYWWFPGQLSALFPLIGPQHLGGQGNIRERAEQEARRTGRPMMEIAEELVSKIDGSVIRAPGLPPMYDHEFHPQDFPMPDGVSAAAFIPAYDSILLSDGLFLVTPESYEPEAVAALRGWLKESTKPTYVIGPLLPTGGRAAAEEKLQSPEAQAIVAFLDNTLSASGERSVLYISFGSIFWPVKTPETLWAFLDVVMDLGIPFIMSHASPLSTIPDSIRAKVQAYGKGLLTKWSPQQLVLNHPATGWFVAHGGQNGVLEAITAGVPQIVWPFDADQPINAVHLAENLGVAYELIEVRSGHGLKPIFRNGRQPAGTVDAVKAEAREVLTKAFGEDGAQKRAKLLQLRKAVLAEWDEGGSSKKEFSAFLDTLNTV
ncbi:UDP-Glycosyltransferase/glycogen phosphorylase [Trametes polyzona]|nr:UDP-Glycosyltransferase/glycogen phosphorylase [Trametes polyzona]